MKQLQHAIFVFSSIIMTLNQANAFDQDSRIEFDAATHTYYVDGKAAPFSVTALVKAPFRPFVARKTIRTMKSRRRGVYQHLSDREIARMWDENGRIQAFLGTKLHEAIEHALLTGEWLDDPAIHTELGQARQFVADVMDGNKLQVYRVEPRIFIDPNVHPAQLMLPGSVDCICKARDDNQFWLLDWKRCKELPHTVKGRFGYGCAPFDQVEDLKYQHYSLQLHLYRHILEQYYGLVIPVDRLLIVQFHPSLSSCQVHTANDLSKEVVELLADPAPAQARVQEAQRLSWQHSQWVEGNAD